MEDTENKIITMPSRENLVSLLANKAFTPCLSKEEKTKFYNLAEKNIDKMELSDIIKDFYGRFKFFYFTSTMKKPTEISSKDCFNDCIAVGEELFSSDSDYWQAVVAGWVKDEKNEKSKSLFKNALAKLFS